jgi:hypothetical protein
MRAFLATTLRPAEAAHKEARRVYGMYASGPQKDAAAAEMNAAADTLLQAQREWEQISRSG